MPYGCRTASLAVSCLSHICFRQDAIPGIMLFKTVSGSVYRIDAHLVEVEVNVGI
jgi:hypothetical protein